MNFECHCVSSLVASPCGHEFREAISCQKRAGENESVDDGACADEFIRFMQCTMETGCFNSIFQYCAESLPIFRVKRCRG